MTESPHQPNALLSRLVMRRLLSVDFHLDRLELHFDGDEGRYEDAVLTCEVWPVVQQPGVVLHQEGFGYADALRALVGQLVLGTTEATGVGIVVELQGASIHVHPGPGEPVGKEIALLRGFSDGAWMAWRPGEVSFEDVGG